MGIKVNKWLKRTLYGFILIVLLVISCIMGRFIERNHHQTLELQKEHVSSIAVVNMDNGVTVGNEQINYASQLVSFPGADFSVTGLTDAKAGIENGTYAAYVVIPETFSESVTSIEHDPRKVTLGYQYNNKLTEEAKIQAVNDINAFLVLLNSNIAYMYMDAIMAEFHRIQDESSIILANDNMELELLAGVSAARLIAVAEPIEDIAVNNDIQPVELSAFITKNNVSLEHMFLSYTEAAQKGKDDYAFIQKENVEVERAADNFFLTYDSVIQDTAAEQLKLLAAGREKLVEAVVLCNQNIEAQETALKGIVADIINMQLEADRNSAEVQLQRIVDDIRNRDAETLKNLQQQWETTYQDLQLEADENLVQKLEICCGNLEELVKAVYMQGYNNALSSLNEQIDSMKEDVDSENIAVSVLQAAINENMLSEPLEPEVEENINNFKVIVGEQISGISIDWNQLNVKLPEISENESGGDGTADVENPDGGEEIGDSEEEKLEITLTAFDDEEAIGNVVGEIFDLFKMEAESERINNVIQTYFVDALFEENEKQMGRLSEPKLLLSQSMEDYEKLLVNYDPLQYIENADLEKYLSDIEINAWEMLDTVEQNNLDYMLYAEEMYAATTEHTTRVRSSLDDANTQTAENVEDCINDLILSRETVNNQNVNMLEGFTDSLKYTRVESQGNAEVYDYIVNPVVSRINGPAVTNTAEPDLGEGNSIKIWLIIILGIGIIFCLAEVVINYRQQYKKSAQESEDMF